LVGITGGMGVLGRLLTAKLKDDGFVVNIFDGDIREIGVVKKWASEVKNDVIFHLASRVAVQDVNSDPFEAYNVNVGGTINLLTSLKKLDKKPWIFFASSSHVYKSRDIAIKEGDDLLPQNIYGETKLAAERVLLSFQKSYGAHVCIGRIFSFFHNIQQKPFLYPTIIDRLKNEDLSKPFKLIGANSIRDLSNAEDIVDKMIKLMEVRACGIVNIGSGIGITIAEFAQKLADQKLNIVSDATETTSILIADVNKFKEIINKR